MLHSLLLLAFLSGQTADIVTTLQHKGPRYYEINPFVPSHPVPFTIAKSGLIIAGAVAGWHMKKDHPRLATLVFVAGATSGTLAAVHNYRLPK